MKDSERNDVGRKIRQIFPHKDEDAVFAQLSTYGVEPYEKEKYRVYRAILKLCEEEGLPDPAKYISAAKKDYRDVLYWAEYPNEAKSPAHTGKDLLNKAGTAKKDKEQYERWLSK